MAVVAAWRTGPAALLAAGTRWFAGCENRGWVWGVRWGGFRLAAKGLAFAQAELGGPVLGCRRAFGVAWRCRRVASDGKRRRGGLIGEDAGDGKRRSYWSNFGPHPPLVRMVEYAHRRHWVERFHEEAKELLGWD